ncbi:hypothetical protein TWF694_010289 [Orbilia ellipsospora]|uniref:Uncharacterized protein n=1 Tax=Orbilia ellipsospora TaxID=2528407 RepID=A0AAV9XAC5_9PEZI
MLRFEYSFWAGFVQIKYSEKSIGGEVSSIIHVRRQLVDKEAIIGLCINSGGAAQILTLRNLSGAWALSITKGSTLNPEITELLCWQMRVLRHYFVIRYAQIQIFTDFLRQFRTAWSSEKGL